MIDIELDGIDYPYPEDGEYRGTWGENATEFAIAVGNAMENRVNKTGAETVGGVKTFQDGIITPTVTTTTSTPATSGVIRLAKTDLISWRDNANTANKELAIDASDRLKFGSTYLSHENWELSTPGSNTVLVATGSYKQMVNPSVDINLTLPSSGILGGDVYFIWNRSATKVITLKSSDADTLCTMIPKSWVKVMSLQTSPTDATHWIQIDGGGSPVAFSWPSTQGFGTITDTGISTIYRAGGCAVIAGFFTPGTPAASEARNTLPFSLSTSATIITSLYPVSDMNMGDQATPLFYQVIADTNKTYLNFWSRSGATTIQANNGNTFAQSGTDIAYRAIVPIKTWEIG